MIPYFSLFFPIFRKSSNSRLFPTFPQFLDQNPTKTPFFNKNLDFYTKPPYFPPFPQKLLLFNHKKAPPLIFVLLNTSYFLFPYKSSFITYRAVEYLISTIHHVSSLILAVVYFIIYPRSSYCTIFYYSYLFLLTCPRCSSRQTPFPIFPPFLSNIPLYIYLYF